MWRCASTACTPASTGPRARHPVADLRHRRRVRGAAWWPGSTASAPSAAASGATATHRPWSSSDGAASGCRPAISCRALERYARLAVGDEERLAGYVEASHGCAHRCRHCPSPWSTTGAPALVGEDAVVADVEQLVALGARHITFGDPDFLNGPHHAPAGRRRRPRGVSPTSPSTSPPRWSTSLRHRDLWPELAAAGCLFAVSAFESASDGILGELDKGHDVAEAAEAVAVLRAAGIEPRPSLRPLHPVDDGAGHGRRSSTWWPAATSSATSTPCSTPSACSCPRLAARDLGAAVEGRARRLRRRAPGLVLGVARPTPRRPPRASWPRWPSGRRGRTVARPAGLRRGARRHRPHAGAGHPPPGRRSTASTRRCERSLARRPVPGSPRRGSVVPSRRARTWPPCARPGGIPRPSCQSDATTVVSTPRSPPAGDQRDGSQGHQASRSASADRAHRGTAPPGRARVGELPRPRRGAHLALRRHASSRAAGRASSATAARGCSPARPPSWSRDAAPTARTSPAPRTPGGSRTVAATLTAEQWQFHDKACPARGPRSPTSSVRIQVGRPHHPPGEGRLHLPQPPRLPRRRRLRAAPGRHRARRPPPRAQARRVLAAAAAPRRRGGRGRARHVGHPAVGPSRLGRGRVRVPLVVHRGPRGLRG